MTSAWRALVPDGPPAGVPLALGFALRRRDRRDRSSAARPTTATVDALTGDDAAGLHVGLRPLERSERTGEWIKGDVSWEEVRQHRPRLDAAHARWMRELAALAHAARRTWLGVDSSEWLTLDEIDSPLLWAHLRAAAPLGIPLVAVSAHDRVTLADSAAAAVDVAPRDDGGLSVSVRVTIDDEPVDAARIRPVAATGVYAFAADGQGIALTLAALALDAAVRALLERGGAVSVPADERDEFLAEAAAPLSRRVDVTVGAGVTVPAIVPPRVIVQARFRRGDLVSYALHWSYPDGTVHSYEPTPDPARDADGERGIRAAVEAAWSAATRLAFAASGRYTGVETAEFSAQVLPALDALAHVTVVITGVRPDYRPLHGVPEITVTTSETPDADWFELGVLVTIDGRTIPFAPLFTALTMRHKKLLLVDGSYFSLTHPALDRLRDLIHEAGDVSEWETGPYLSRYQTALWAEFEDLADHSEPALSWRAHAAALRDVTAIAPMAPPPGLRATLRPYQRDGFHWLAFLWRHRLGGILADDMGLGKTLQMLALVAHAAADVDAPFLVVAPTSVVDTWRGEAARFTPDLDVRVLDATAARRGEAPGDAVHGADLVITSYAILRLDAEEFASVRWAGVILDEAQFVKNPATVLHRAVKALDAEVVFAVTGTPMENTLVDLWALLSLTSPGLFASAVRFREDYVKPIEQGKVPENEEGGPYRRRRLERLRRRIRPLVLRRTKEDVAPELPPKQEQVLRLELGPAHRAHYDRVLQRERQKVLGLLDDLDRNRFIVSRSLTLLRMLALAPQLVDPAHATLGSAKLDALLDRVTEAASEGHRTLVFSQFTSFLRLAADRLDAAGIAYAYLDGSTRRRGAVIDGFRTGDAPVFLLSLKAGGFGLTLTEADYVFVLDPWWNPAAEAQAVDRTHRIGQDRTVIVYRMIAVGTIEEKVLALQERKARLFQAVVDDDALFSGALTADDIRALLDG